MPEITDHSGTCDLCGEPYDYDDPRPSFNEVAEMYDPKHPYTREPTTPPTSGIVHGQCGIDAGWEMA